MRRIGIILLLLLVTAPVSDAAPAVRYSVSLPLVYFSDPVQPDRVPLNGNFEDPDREDARYWIRQPYQGGADTMLAVYQSDAGRDGSRGYRVTRKVAAANGDGVIIGNLRLFQFDVMSRAAAGVWVKLSPAAAPSVRIGIAVYLYRDAAGLVASEPPVIAETKPLALSTDWQFVGIALDALRLRTSGAQSLRMIVAVQATAIVLAADSIIDLDEAEIYATP